MVSQHGRPDNGSDAAGFFNAEFFVPLKPFDEWPAGMTKEKLIEELQTEFNKEFVGIDFNFSQYIQDNVEEALSGVKGANSVKIIGPDLDDPGTDRAAGLARDGQGAGHYRPRHRSGCSVSPISTSQIDRDKAARYGLNADDVNSVVQAALGGTYATTVLEADRQFGVAVRLAPEYRNNIDAVRNVKVGAIRSPGSNAYIPLSEVATITLDTGASYIFREKQPALHSDQVQRARPRSRRARWRRRSSGSAENVKLPNGYRIDLGRRVRVVCSRRRSGC